jgi:hypothetical protein
MDETTETGGNQAGRGPDGKFLPGNHEGEETQFSPGVSGNPKGRGDAWADIENEMLSATSIEEKIDFLDKDGQPQTKIIKMSMGEKRTFRHGLTARKIQMGIGGDLAAMQDLEDRERGRATQSMNLGGQRDNPLFEDPYTDKEKAAIAKTLRDIRGGDSDVTAKQN